MVEDLPQPSDGQADHACFRGPAATPLPGAPVTVLPAGIRT